MLAEYLTVRLLVTGTSRRTSILLGLSTTRIYNKNQNRQRTSSNEGPIEGDEKVLDFTLGLFVDIYSLSNLCKTMEIHFW